MAESWKSVAKALAVRLNHMPEPDCSPVNPACGYCSDGLAYQRFVKRLAADDEQIHDPLADAVGIPVSALRTRSADLTLLADPQPERRHP